MVDYSLKMTTFARNIKTRIKAIKKNMANDYLCTKYKNKDKSNKEKYGTRRCI